MSIMRIELTEDDLYTRNGVLDSLMESTYDAALLVDDKGYIIHACNGGDLLRTLTKEESIGRHFHEINANSNFIIEVLKTGKAMHGIIDIVQGRKSLVNIYPIYSGKKLIGAMATILFSSLSSLKKVFSQLSALNSKEEENFYNTLARMSTSYTINDFIGNSIVTKNLLTQCKRVASTRHPILLIGESGTGKEILANAIHSESMKNIWKPFIKINCSAIPKDLLESELFGYEKGAFTGAISTKKGKFELANGGSILLDEIGDMDISLQSKLLRVLEEKEFERVGGSKMIPLNARVIASTNANLRQLSNDGNFRSDLYYRLSTIQINVPPLRYRKDDIPLLIKYFIKKEQYNFDLTPDAFDVFFQYEWPGNVRELRNIINRIGILCDEKSVTAKDIYPFFDNTLESATQIDEETHLVNTLNDEAQLVIQALQRSNFNVTKAARDLGVCRATLYNKLKKYNIKINK